MKATSVKSVRCAIYTRVSTKHGLDQEFNSLDAQYEAASAYIKSQAHAGWTLTRSRYDDGGYSGGSTDRPAVHQANGGLSPRTAKRIGIFTIAPSRSATQSIQSTASRSSSAKPRCTSWQKPDLSHGVRQNLSHGVAWTPSVLSIVRPTT